MRDRLIELITNATTEVTFRTSGGRPVTKIQRSIVDRAEAKDLADHLIANGVILPPMRLGQICYEPYSWQDEADECRVSSITQKADGTFKIRLTNLQGKWVFEITAEDIGKTVFLTKEDAEKTLKEKENGNL